MNLKYLFPALVLALMSLGALPAIAQQVLTGDAAFTDYTKEQPGVRRKVTVDDLPQPYATPSANNAPVVSPRPDGAMLHTLPGFKVEQFATGLNNPRLMRMAPNGDIFLAESEPGKIIVIRGIGADGKAGQMETFATDQKGAFGINFYPSGPPSEMGLCWQHRIRGSFSLQGGRPEGPRPGTNLD